MSIYIIFLVSAVLCIVGVIQWMKSARLLMTGKKATGTIIENKISKSYQSVTYFPVISFHDQEGQLRSEILTLGFSPAKELGSKIEILYNPEDKSEITINNNLMLVIVPRILTVVGLTGVIASLLDISEIANIFP